MVFSRLLLVCALLVFSGSALAVDPTTLTLTRTGSTLSGKLVDAFGNPVIAATVNISTVDTNARLGPVTQSVNGTTPAAAVNAQVGIVIGENGACVCNGRAAAVVGGLTYSDNGSPHNSGAASVMPNPFPYPNVPFSVVTFDMQPNQPLNETVGQFAVDPNASFTFSAPIMATANAAQAGYAFISFVDARNNVLATYKIWFTPNAQSLTSVTTDLSGQFSLTLAAHVYLADPQIQASWGGNLIYGPSSATAAPLGLNPANTMPALQQPLTGNGTATNPLIWMGPLPDFISAVNSSGWSAELANWPISASHTNVIRLPVSEITDSTFTQDQLAQFVHDLNASGMVLELEIGPADNWPGDEPSCAFGESYSDPASVNTAVSRLMAAGANLSIVAMDEPLWYGRYQTPVANKYGGCQSTVSDVVTRVYKLLHIWKAAFPNLVYGDIEPFPYISDEPNWASDYASFISGVESQTGVQVAFMHMDIDWDQAVLETKGDPTKPDSTMISQLINGVAGVVRGNAFNNGGGMKLGIIIDGNNGSAMSTATWMSEAEKHIGCVAASGVNPEQLSFASWAKYPTTTVPEQDAAALTNLIYSDVNGTASLCQ